MRFCARRLGLACALVLWFAGSASGAAAEPEIVEHEIKLSRRLEVGSRFRISAVGTRSSTSEMSREGQLLRREQQELRVELSGLLEVLRVDAAGRPLEHALGLDYLVWGTGGELDQALPTDQRVIAETVGGKTEFRLEHGRLPPLAVEALHLVVGTYRGDVPDEDLLFGSRLPRTVGESWAFHREAFAEAMRTTGAVVDPDGLSGAVTLERLERIEDIDCLRITARVDVGQFAMSDLPAGVELESGRAEVTISGLFPTDPSRHKMQDRTSVSMELVMRGREGPLAGARVTTRSTRTGEKTMVPF